MRMSPIDRIAPALPMAVLALVLCAADAPAEPYPSYDDLFVNDLAEVLPDASESEIRGQLEALKAETGIEMTLLTIPTRLHYDASSSIETFATGLFNDWGIGDETRNDGILVLIAPEDREMRLELGSGYDQGYDVLARDMVDRYFLPEFRSGDYDAGIRAGVTETVERIARRHAARLPPEALPTQGSGSIAGWIFGAAFAGIAALVVFARRIGDLIAGMRPCPQCGKRGLHRTHETVRAATTSEEGLQRTETQCPSCGYRDTRTTPTPRRSSSRSGSFGGGKSSGGGATGRW